MNQISQDVAGGESLADALAKHPKIFSKLYCAMVRSGEAGGMLDVILSRLADFAEQEAEVRGKIKSALAYPLIMVFAGIGAVIILMTVVMPKILRIYTEMGQALPMPTQILISSNKFLRDYWYIILGVVLVGGGALWRAVRTEEGRRVVDNSSCASRWSAPWSSRRRSPTSPARSAPCCTTAFQSSRPSTSPTR